MSHSAGPRLMCHLTEPCDAPKSFAGERFVTGGPEALPLPAATARTVRAHGPGVPSVTHSPGYGFEKEVSRIVYLWVCTFPGRPCPGMLSELPGCTQAAGTLRIDTKLQQSRAI